MFFWIMAFFFISSSDEESVDNIKIMQIKILTSRLFDDFWEWRLRNYPQFATKIGVTNYDDKLNDMSINAYRRRANEIHFYLKRLNQLTKGFVLANNTEFAINVQILRGDLVQFLSGMKYKPYLFPINNLENPHINYIHLLHEMKKETADDMKNIIIRLRLFSHQVNEIINLMKTGIRMGLTHNRRSFDKLMSTYRKISTVSVDFHPFFNMFRVKPPRLDKSSWKTIVKEARFAIRYFVRPSSSRLLSFLLKDYLLKSRHQTGVISLPRGKDYYEACLKFHTTTDLNSVEVHHIGLSEVGRIHARMEEVKKKVGYNGTISQFRQHFETSNTFRFKDTDEILGYYNTLENRVSKLMPKYFNRTSSIPLNIRPVPDDISNAAPTSYYSEPSITKSRPGVLFVNTYQPELRHKHHAMAAFLHKALPGHHHHLAFNKEFGSRVKFRQYAEQDTHNYDVPVSFASNIAMIEGWGLYSKYLGEEMDLYDNPYDLFARLTIEMNYASDLVVDTGIHAFGWSRSQAILFLSENNSKDMNDVTEEVDRIISWPGQSCLYKVGEIKLIELRKLVEACLGDEFDIRDFHDFVVSRGNIPLRVLSEQVHLYIDRKSKK